MKKIALTVMLLVFALLSMSGWASEITDATLDKLLTLSGTTMQLTQMPVDVKTGLNQARENNSANNRARISAAEYEALGKIIDDAFQPAMLLQTTRQEMRKAVSEEEARSMFAWFTSEQGKQVTEAEVAVLDAAAYQEMASAADKLLADKIRVQFIRDVNEQLHTTDLVLDIEENTAVTMYMAFSGGAGDQMDPSKFRSDIAAALQKERPNIERFLTLQDAHTYRNIDTPTLLKYREFLNTPGARHFNEGIMKALSRGLKQATSTMAVSLAEYYRKNPGQRHATSGPKRPPDQPDSPYSE